MVMKKVVKLLSTVVHFYRPPEERKEGRGDRIIGLASTGSVKEIHTFFHSSCLFYRRVRVKGKGYVRVRGSGSGSFKSCTAMFYLSIHLSIYLSIHLSNIHGTRVCWRMSRVKGSRRDAFDLSV